MPHFDTHERCVAREPKQSSINITPNHLTSEATLLSNYLLSVTYLVQRLKRDRTYQKWREHLYPAYPSER
ncbi:hypothetical protein AFLA_004805 [Aspergillus flavus NRRL3357]|nr:hypothetical protein AFLA_004805 [Aspergillus flavus NRRL3357]